MALNKDEKINIVRALDILTGYKNKPEINENAGQRLEIRFAPAFASNDEEVLRKLAEEVFGYLERYPELKQELKDKYFKTI